jgi:hypothetical protein
MRGEMLNGVAKHFSELADGTMKAMGDIQKTPVGTRERSPQEGASLWRKMRQIPQPEFDNMMNLMAAEVGHTNDEEQPCAVCSFVLDHASREKK